MVYSTAYDKNPDRQIPDRADRSPPDLFVPGRDLRHRSGIQQYRGMVAFDPRGRPAAQGPAVLSPARRQERDAPSRSALSFQAEGAISRPGWQGYRWAAAPRAWRALRRRVSAAPPVASSGFPQKPSDRSADRHRPWRIRQAVTAASA